MAIGQSRTLSFAAYALAHRFGGLRRVLGRVTRWPQRDCDAKLLITADEGLRGGRRFALKANADEALHVDGPRFRKRG